MHRRSSLGLALVLSAVLATAQEEGAEVPATPTLSVGDPAPKLALGSWLQGTPVERFEPGQVYVLDFWATWCGPCIRAIPHMTEIQEEYAGKGVRVVGVSIWESTPSGVKPFVEKNGSQMGYAVATDEVPPLPEGVEEGTAQAGRWSTEHGAMSRTWMEAAGRNGIPCVFIVDAKGRIAWIGHPMSGMDDALAKIVAGSWDLEAAAAAFREERRIAELRDRLQSLLHAKSYPEAFGLAREHLEGAFCDDAFLLNQVAWTIVDPAGDVREKDLDLALKAASRANTLTGEKNPAILDTLARVHFLLGHLEEALELQARAVELSPAELREDLQKTLEEYRKAHSKK